MCVCVCVRDRLVKEISEREISEREISGGDWREIRERERERERY